MKIRLSNISFAIIALLILSSCRQGTSNAKSETQPIQEAAAASEVLDPIFTQNPATGDFLTKFFTDDVRVNA